MERTTHRIRPAWAEIGFTLWLGFVLSNGVPAVAEPLKNGFDLEGASVPVEEIRSGGPPRDGIPSLEDPAMVSHGDTPWADDVLVLGVAVGDSARAYPIPILDWHEIVNDTVGGQPILISWCPLCGTGMVFDRRDAKGKARSFGVSGLLYKADLLMYDRETQSLWSQISSRAVTGPSRGEGLTLLRSRVESLADWRKRHPDTEVLSRRTGFRRDYRRSPYEGYSTSEALLFPMETDRRYHAKMPTLGIRDRSGKARAYPAAEIVKAGGRVEEDFAGTAVVVSYDRAKQVFSVEAAETVDVIEGYWFAWAAFHPETSVFESGEGAATPSETGPAATRSATDPPPPNR